MRLGSYDLQQIVNKILDDTKVLHKIIDTGQMGDEALSEFFSNYDNIRSIPNMIDGLKPSQRKVLYSGLLKNLINEKKNSYFVTL